MNKVIKILIFSLCYLNAFGKAPNINKNSIKKEYNQEANHLNQETFINLKNAIEEQDITLMEQILSQINNNEKITYYLKSENGEPLVHKAINKENSSFISSFLNQLPTEDQIKCVLIYPNDEGKTTLKIIFEKGFELRLFLLAESLQKNHIKAFHVFQEIISNEPIRPEVIKTTKKLIKD